MGNENSGKGIALDKKFNFTYKITNLINNKYYYGCHSSNDPWADGYMGSGNYLNRAYKKYGKDNFKIERLENFSNRKKMFEAEEKLITEEIVNDKNSYNLIGGGYGSIFISDSTRVKLSRQNKGRVHTKQSRKNMSDAHKNNNSSNTPGIVEQAKKLRGRTKETHKYIADMSNKMIGKTKKDTPHLVKMAEAKTGWTKENHSGTSSQAEKMRGRTKDTHSGVLSQSKKLTGRTKENYKYLKSASEKMTGRTKKNNFSVFKMALSKSTGIWVTPCGNFYSCNDAKNFLGISKPKFISWCKNRNNQLIKIRQSCTVIEKIPNYYNKTFKEVGFGFIPFPKECKSFENRKQFAINNNVKFDNNFQTIRQ